MSAAGYLLAGFGLGLLVALAAAGSIAMKEARWIRPWLASIGLWSSVAIGVCLAGFLSLAGGGLMVGFGAIVASGLATVVKVSVPSNRERATSKSVYS